MAGFYCDALDYNLSQRRMWNTDSKTL